MLTAIRIYNALGDMLELPFDDSTEYIVKHIDGLGPVKADIATTAYATMDGGVYQAAKGNMRNIVFQLGFDPSYTSEDPFGELRRSLYPFLAPKLQVEMHFISNNFPTVKIIGYVESFEPSIFVAAPEQQISILCPDPYFYATESLSVTRNTQGTLTVMNPGNVESGLMLYIEGIMLEEEDITLRRTAPTVDTMQYLGPLNGPGPNWDPTIIEINTVKGSKYAGFRDPETNELIDNFISYINGWIDVLPGINTFEITLPPAIDESLFVLIQFTPKYVGL